MGERGSGGKEPVPSERNGETEKRESTPSVIPDITLACHVVTYVKTDGVMSRNPIAFVIANNHPCEAIPITIKAIKALSQGDAERPF